MSKKKGDGDTVESLRAKIAKIEKRLQTQAESLEAAKERASRSRVGRSLARKQVYALRAVLKAHNIGFDVSGADLDKLEVTDGVVSGEFEYTPPDPNKGGTADPPGGKSPGTLTKEDVAKMPHSEIMSRWAEVQAVMNPGYKAKED